MNKLPRFKDGSSATWEMWVCETRTSWMIGSLGSLTFLCRQVLRRYSSTYLPLRSRQAGKVHAVFVVCEWKCMCVRVAVASLSTNAFSSPHSISSFETPKLQLSCFIACTRSHSSTTSSHSTILSCPSYSPVHDGGQRTGPVLG